MGLIFQDAMGGIHFKHLKDDECIDAHCGDDDVYVVVGDVMEIWTNEMVKAPDSRKMLTCDHSGKKPAGQILFYYVGGDFEAVACDLMINNGQALEIVKATNNEQQAVKDVLNKKFSVISHIESVNCTNGN